MAEQQTVTITLSTAECIAWLKNILWSVGLDTAPQHLVIRAKLLAADAMAKAGEGISVDMLLSDDEIKLLDDEYVSEIGDGKIGDEGDVNKLIYMGYKLNHLIKALAAYRAAGGGK